MRKTGSFGKLLIVLVVLLLPAIAYLLLQSGENQYRKLQIYGPREAPPDGNEDTVFHTVQPFELVAQNGLLFSSTQLDGKIYVADFFFATCQTICPEMTMQMKRIQETFKNDTSLFLISHTVNPAHDTAEVLRAYADEFGAADGKWFFLTGDKKSIYDLARHSYFVTALPGDGGPHDFIHSEKLILVDPDKRIRGYYDGTEIEDVSRLIEEIKVLQWEYNFRNQH